MHIRPASLLLLAALVSPAVFAPAWAAEDPMEKVLYDICQFNDAGWIGKDQKAIDSNCRCKARSEAAMATPEFREELLTKGVYNPLLIADSDRYLGQVLKACPKLGLQMIDATCKDPAAPPDACQAMKDMISTLK